MQIIPVIDIKAGQAVLAKQGNRKNYLPLSTNLCHSSQVDDVINAYLGVFPFTRMYIADLDALMGLGNNQYLINALFTRYPQLSFMVDSGSLKTPYTPLRNQQLTTIIGTESITTKTLAQEQQLKTDFILSLDFNSEHAIMGDAILYASPALWPKALIIMTLGLVGKNNGPDLEKLQYYCSTYPQHNFIAAGGIRHYEDLLQLKKLGIQQALIASALHNKKLTTQNIEQLQKPI
ncbi:MAG: HisA/HisF-related TIM barrel protein [Methyloprofundus sp.]|nr:HisA/HisF-related TIM barrel protein [Methyloprofundus sp.]MDT8424954.1 HisA/HisF-related TIM barrel protein [Methyloprofundus sp.]